MVFNAVSDNTARSQIGGHLSIDQLGRSVDFVGAFVIGRLGAAAAAALAGFVSSWAQWSAAGAEAGRAAVG